MTDTFMDCECSDCGATGLYAGFAERPGAAVVCKPCKGTGSVKLKMPAKFTGRRGRNGIRMVFPCNVGYQLRPDSKGGIPYADWAAGIPFSDGTEDRARTCPEQYYQTAEHTKQPHFDACNGCNIFQNCRNYPTKASCWERWDKQQPLDRSKDPTPNRANGMAGPRADVEGGGR